MGVFRRRTDGDGSRDRSSPGPGHSLIVTGGARDVRPPPAAGLRDLVRPATVVLLLVPVSMLGATSTGGRFTVVAATAALVPVVATLLALGVLPFRLSYLWLALFAGLLLVSFFRPVMTTRVAPPVRPRLADHLDVLRAAAPLQLSRLADLAGLLCGLALTGLLIASRPHPRQVARVIALSGTAAAAYVLVRGQFVHARLAGLGCNPNYLGCLLAAPLVTAVGLTRYTRNPRWLLPAALCGLALLQTHSRSAFLAAAVGVVCAVFLGRSWRAHALLAAGLAAGAGVAAATGMLGRLSRHLANLGAADRTATDLHASNGQRAQVAELAARVIADHPFRGIGYALFPAYAQRSPGFAVYLGTHDEYLRLAAEAGVPALLVFLVLFGLGVLRRRPGELAMPQAVLLTYVVLLLFANPLANPVVGVAFWGALGCLLAWRPCRAPGPSRPSIAVRLGRSGDGRGGAPVPGPASSMQEAGSHARH
ncbi:O-antigen ligase family protein [Actinoallomurus soli]|uniref:O-antigen ligase family protein n=1 Tax=Actinoallomurus soli TaxID=2952535 RepID=UPI00209224B2|nr:O-antigen ligase family protein [Actinoallomurus soli]MCO5969991.1 O-antigen ligase family protein [Actinoallomurus soli]